MNTIGSRIAAAREAKGLNQSELARALGITPQAVQKWENDGSTPRGTRMRELADVLGAKVEQLLFGNDYRMTVVQSLANVEDAKEFKGSVPLISWVQAGHWSEVIDNLSPGEAEEWLPRMTNLGPRAYALRVRGISMFNPLGKPSYDDGDIVYVDPDWNYNHLDRVVVRLNGDMEATFKQLIIEGDKMFLRALNPDWPGPKLIPIDDEATMCGVVRGKWVSE
jgi:SOS-response transcriptional repressor LexA